MGRAWEQEERAPTPSVVGFRHFSCKLQGKATSK